MYGPASPAWRSTVGAEHVVVGEQVVEAELLDRLRVGAHAAQVGADLGLREDDAELHRRIRRLEGRDLDLPSWDVIPRFQPKRHRKAPD